MEDTFNVNAIILDKISYKEKDVKLVVFSDEFGKMELVARGAKKMKSKISGHIEPIIFSKIMVVRGKRINYAGTAIGQEFYVKIRNNLDNLILAGKAIRLVNDLSREGETGSNSKVFKILKNYLDFLDYGDDSKTKIFNDFFILKFISSIGFKPNLTLLPGGTNNFNLESGSMVEKDGCANTLLLTNDCVNILNLIFMSKFEALRELKIGQKLQGEISRFVKSFVEFHVPNMAKN